MLEYFLYVILVFFESAQPLLNAMISNETEPVVSLLSYCLVWDELSDLLRLKLALTVHDVMKQAHFAKYFYVWDDPIVELIAQR